MRKTKRNLRKTKSAKKYSKKDIKKYIKKYLTKKLGRSKVDKLLKRYKLRKIKKSKKSRKSRKLRGGGSFVPQDLVNTFRGIQDGVLDLYSGFKGGNPPQSSSVSSQPALMRSSHTYEKMPNLQQLNEEADLRVSKMLN